MLVFAEVPESVQLDSTQNQWFWNNVPTTIVELTQAGKKKDVTITPVAEGEVTFDDFWNLYAYKHGKKDRTKMLWQSMTDIERTLCMAAIPKYKFWLHSQNGMNCLYPQTFLSQRRWENDYSV